MEKIYVIAPDGEVLSSTKTGDYNDFFGWSEEDFNNYFDTQKEEKNGRANDQKNLELCFNDALKAVVTESKQQNERESSRTISIEEYIDKKDTKGSTIRKNREKEKELLRKEKKTIDLINPENIAKSTQSSNNAENSNNSTDRIELAIKRLLKEDD
jgi:hypothetical protein